MRIRVLFVFLFLLAAQPVLAQEEQQPNAAAEDQAVLVSPAKKAKPIVFDRKQVGLEIGLHIADSLDIASTYRAFQGCSRCSEGDPYAAWFINRGPTVAYPAAVMLDVGIMYLAGKMRQSDNPALRHIWWALPVVKTGLHLLEVRHNTKRQ